MTVTPLHVVSLFELAPEQQARIAAVDPRVRVTLAPYTVRPDGVSPSQPLADADLRQALRAANVIFTNRLPSWVPAETPTLDWVQFSQAGMEGLTKHPIWSSDVTLTNGTGIQAPMIAEWAMAMVHHFAKVMPRLIADQRAHVWSRFDWRYRPIAGATLGVIGLGHIGSEVAWRGRALRMRVLGTRRSATGRRLHADGVDELFPPDQLGDLLAQSDYVVICVPHTRQTDRLIGPREFAAMRPGAALINVCRGGVVDEAALIEALKSGQLGGAALDVFEQEPLPTSSPLWDMPNVVVSPHVSGAIAGTVDLALDLLTENLRRRCQNQPLLNVVSREKGY